MECHKIDRAAVVVSDGWPSVAFSLVAQGYTNVTIVLPGNLVALLKVIQRETDGLEGVTILGSITEYESTVDLNIRHASIAFIQGQPEFTQRHDLAFSGTVRDRIVLQTMVKRREGGLIVSHANLGGATNGRWKVHLSPSLKLKSGWNQGSVERRLHHILRTTENGISVSSEMMLRLGKRKRGPRVITGESRVNSGEYEIDVVAPCVMKKSGYVKRRLTAVELCECYDLQVAVGKTVVDKALEDQSVLKSIVLAVPEKVTSALVRNLEGACKALVKSL